MVDRVFILRYHRCLAQAQPDVVVSNTDGDELGRTSKTLCATRLNGSVEAYYHVGNAATPPKETAAALMGASSILMLEAYHHETASPRLSPASAFYKFSFPRAFPRSQNITCGCSRPVAADSGLSLTTRLKLPKFTTIPNQQVPQSRAQCHDKRRHRLSPSFPSPSTTKSEIEQYN
ncbi:hypothetical protein V495_04480 [Pseudogymnoascus sp. VKM F-4514 (FW-929)]|nr:hypothetical protein V495_04480 [Pseudogymnoascus sp. VKM F-4514 (FW-929)]